MGNCIPDCEFVQKGLYKYFYSFYMCLGISWQLVPLMFFQKHDWLILLKDKETEVPLLYCV